MDTTTQDATVEDGGIPLLNPPAVETTLVREFQYYHELLEHRMRTYNARFPGTVAQQVLSTIIAQTEKCNKMSEDFLSRLLALIQGMVNRGEPILITLSFAIACRIPNPLKYGDRTQLPTRGWMHFFWFFKFLSEKVKCVYPPGIRVVVFDEALLLGEQLGLEKIAMQQCLDAARNLIAGMDAPIEIRVMPPEDFPRDEIAEIHVSLREEQVYPYICALPEMNDPMIMELLYQKRNRDYTAIRRHVGEQMWGRATENARMVNKMLTWRKDRRLFAQWLGTSAFIDATLTDKADRVVFDISATLINHGMPLVQERTNGHYKLRVVPDYRLRDQGHLTLVKIRAGELHPEYNGNAIPFYYREK